MRIAREFKEKHLSVQEKSEKEKKTESMNEREKQTLVSNEKQTLSGEKNTGASGVARKSEVKSAIVVKQQLLVLMYKDVYLTTTDLNSSLPSVVVSLLQEYEDLFPEEVPRGLPPIRGIEHHIDFMPGASIPNRPAYRANPEETKEIQRQVDDLVEKGFVRESLSPCLVPVILVPKKDGTWRMCIDC